MYQKRRSRLLVRILKAIYDLMHVRNGGFNRCPAGGFCPGDRLSLSRIYGAQYFHQRPFDGSGAALLPQVTLDTLKKQDRLPAFRVSGQSLPGYQYRIRLFRKIDIFTNPKWFDDSVRSGKPAW